MPASLPGSTKVINDTGNPALGLPIMMDPLSGPNGSPFDKAGSAQPSTGGLCTGIGFGPNHVVSPISNPLISNVLAGIRAAGFSDDYIPGLTKPNGLASPDSTLVYIGGGRSVKPNSTGYSAPNPYTAGFALASAGNGQVRDGGAGPAFTGAPTKMVTATGPTPNGSDIEAGWANRSGVPMTIDQSAFGVGAPQAAPSLND